MTDHPMLFSGPMVRALIDGRKSQTRRIMKPQPVMLDSGLWHVYNAHGGSIGVKQQDIGDVAVDYVPYYEGQKLWVRETWQLHSRATDVCTVVYASSINGPWFAACEQFPDRLAGKLSPKPFQDGWRPSIFMPRWASRLTLEVTSVKVERLWDISKKDVIAEGITERNGLPIKDVFAGWHEPYAALWNWLNGKKYPWSSNPFVVAISFKVHRGNIDALPPQPALQCA